MSELLLPAIILIVCILAGICIWREDKTSRNPINALRSKLAAVFWLSTSLTMMVWMGQGG